jgi:hypothetical protein
VSRALLELNYPADQMLSKLARVRTSSTFLPQQLTQLEKSQHWYSGKESHQSCSLWNRQKINKYWVTFE